jgi:hypothetical protein
MNKTILYLSYLSVIFRTKEFYIGICEEKRAFRDVYNLKNDKFVKNIASE